MSAQAQAIAVKTLPRDRRQFVRQPVDSLGCIFLSGQAGGVVVNVSEGGMTLYSALALDSASLESLRFQLPLSSAWIEARGKIAWASETKNLAGFQFDGLSESARTQIRDWISVRNPKAPAKSEAAGPKPANKPPIADRAVEAEDESGPADNLERALRRFFARHEDPIVARAVRKNGLSWKFVTAIALLALVSLVVGLAASHNKALAPVEASAKDAIPAADSGSSAEANAPARAPLERTSRQPEYAAMPAELVQAPRFTVTSEIQFPVSYAQGGASKTPGAKPGRIEHRVDPDYPSAALARGIEGTVLIHADIAPDGAVHAVSAISGPPLLAPSAVSAVKLWRYTPSLLNGKPVEAEANIAIVFWLPARAERDQR